tara:strand:- start:925 stop:1536 length:612 start_codon:yes stop_codon:yes gene_type:complete
LLNHATNHTQTVVRHLRSALTKRKESVTQLSFYENRNWNIFENKTNKMRIFLLLLILTLTFGCATRNIKYDRNKILKKYASEFDIILDSENVNLENLYLDKDNIKATFIDRKEKTVIIDQLKKTELITLNTIYLDSLSKGRRGWNKKEIGFIIIDGILLNDKTTSEIKLDPNAIKDFRIQKGEDSKDSRIFRMNKDYLIIRTK